MVCGEQRRRCCAFSAQSAINLLIITMFSQKKLNTDGVESPCERLPGVGSFLANPGLSKEQLVPSCVVRIFIMVDISIEVLTLNIWRCIVITFIMSDVFIGILAHFAIYLFVY